MTSNWRTHCEACGKPQHGNLTCHEITATRTVTHSDLSLPCGCIVTVWPHGRGDSPGVEAEVTGKCRAHSEDVAATVRAWHKNAHFAGAVVAAYSFEQVLRLLDAEPEGKP